MNNSIGRSFLISMLIAAATLCMVVGRAQAIPVPVAINVSPEPLGSNWEQTESGGFFPTFELVPVGAHRIEI